jgi:hypothetical protein
VRQARQVLVSRSVPGCRPAASAGFWADGHPVRAGQSASVDDLPAVIDFDAGSLVLTTFGRSNSGTVRGDADLADRFLNLFYQI